MRWTIGQQGGEIIVVEIGADGPAEGFNFGSLPARDLRFIKLVPTPEPIHLIHLHLDVIVINISERQETFRVGPS